MAGKAKDANELAQAGDIDGVRDMMDSAKVVKLPARKKAAAAEEPAPPPAKQRRGNGREREPIEPELPMLPEGCPVICLGQNRQTYHFLDALGQHIELQADKVAQRGIMSLFGTEQFLPQQFWPRYGKADEKTGEAKVTGVEWNHATMALMGRCAGEGVFDALTRLRGRGGHKGPDGELILHCGDRLWIGPVPGQDPDSAPGWCAPGVVEGHADMPAMVYPSGAKLPRPAADPANTLSADYLVNDLFSTWQWKREVDPILLLGMVMAMPIGGALEWRPVGWITGDSAMGKSTLLELIELIQGGWLLKVDDATEAGVRQRLDADSIPVALDEQEAEENNTRINALVKLARLAASGGFGLKGSSDHKAKGFTIRSIFLFSSILLPALTPQDRNRMAILELLKFRPGDKPPLMDPATLRNTGAALRRRMRDHWPRLAPTLNHFRGLLTERGHIGRGANVFGTLLACAYIALHDEDLDAPVAGAGGRSIAAKWADQLAAGKLSELADEMSNADRCAAHLGSSPLSGVSGAAPMSVGWWCRKMLDSGAPGDPKARLGACGLRVVQRKLSGATDEGGGDVYEMGDPPVLTDATSFPPNLIPQLYLAVASAHRGLDPLFRDTPWQGRPGAAGGWGQALRRVDGAIGGERVRIDGKTAACTLVPLSALADLGAEGAE